jgi:mTERF domain-containing protein
MGSAAAAAAIRKSNPSQVHLLSKGFEDPGHNAHAALACMRAGSGMTPEQLSAALGKYPKMLDYSPEKLTKCFGFLGKSCGLNAEERGRVIAATPQVLGLSVEENLAHKLHLLVHELELGEDGAREAIVGFPQVLTYNTDSLRARFEYFLEDVGCTPTELVAMLASYPQGVITLSMDNIARSVGFVTDVFARLPSDDYQRRNLGDGAPATLAARMICKNPTLLGYSVDRKMRPTVEYVSANYPACCAMQALKMCTSSLGGTVMTRCFFKERAGWNVQLVTVSLFLLPYGQLD